MDCKFFRHERTTKAYRKYKKFAAAGLRNNQKNWRSLAQKQEQAYINCVKLSARYSRLLRKRQMHYYNLMLDEQVGKFTSEVSARFNDCVLQSGAPYPPSHVIGPTADTYIDIADMDFVEIEYRVLGHAKGVKRAKNT